MNNLMEWVLILVTAYNFLSIWLLSHTLENILKILLEMNEEASKKSKV